MLAPGFALNRPRLLWQNLLFSVAKTWLLLSIRFHWCVQSHQLYPSSYILCTISLWTTHLVDFPATINRWSILCLNSEQNKQTNKQTKQKTKNLPPARPPPFSWFVWKANKHFSCLKIFSLLSILWRYVSSRKSRNYSLHECILSHDSLNWFELCLQYNISQCRYARRIVWSQFLYTILIEY